MDAEVYKLPQHLINIVQLLTLLANLLKNTRRSSNWRIHPVPGGFLPACYIRDMYNRLYYLKAVATAVYGRILKIDSSNKITKKLQGANVGNQKEEVLNSVITASESIVAPQVMADGLTNRFWWAATCSSLHWPRMLQHSGRWENLLVRLVRAIHCTPSSWQVVKVHVCMGSTRPWLLICSQQIGTDRKWD